MSRLLGIMYGIEMDLTTRVFVGIVAVSPCGLGESGVGEDLSERRDMLCSATVCGRVLALYSDL